MSQVMPSVQDLYNLQTDLADFAEFLNTPDVKDITTRLGKVMPSLKKIVDEVRRSNSAYSFTTLAALQAAGTPQDISGDDDAEVDIMCRVWNDSSSGNNGLYGWDGAKWSLSEYDMRSIARQPNQLFDPYFEYVSADLDFGGFSHFYNTTPVFGESPSNPFDSPAILASAETVQRYYRVPEQGDSGMLSVAVYAWFAESGGEMSLHCRTNGNGLTGDNIYKYNLPAGLVYQTLTIDPVATNAPRFSVRVHHDTDDFAVFAILGARGNLAPAPNLATLKPGELNAAIAKFIQPERDRLLAAENYIADQQARVFNALPDPTMQYFMSTPEIDDIRRISTAGDYRIIDTPAHSPYFPTPKAIGRGTSANFTDIWVDVATLGAVAGDSVTVLVDAWFENADGTIVGFQRDSNGALVNNDQWQFYGEGQGDNAISRVFTVEPGAATLAIRVQQASDNSDYQIFGVYAVKGSQPPERNQVDSAKMFRYLLDDTSTLSATLASQQADITAIKNVVDNVLPDPTMQYFMSQPVLNGSRRISTAGDYRVVDEPTNSPYSPVPKAVGRGASANFTDIWVDVETVGAQPGDTVTVLVDAWFESAGGTITGFQRYDGSGLVSNTQWQFYGEGQGNNAISAPIVIETGTRYIAIRVQQANDESDYQIFGVYAALGTIAPQRTQLVGSALLDSIFSAFNRTGTPNALVDPTFQFYKDALVIAGRRRYSTTVSYRVIETPTESPYTPIKDAIGRDSANFIDIWVDIAGIGAAPGDSISILLDSWFENAGGTVTGYQRNAGGGLVNGTAWPFSSVSAGNNASTGTVVVAEGADYIAVRVQQSADSSDFMIFGVYAAIGGMTPSRNEPFYDYFFNAIYQRVGVSDGSGGDNVTGDNVTIQDGIFYYNAQPVNDSSLPASYGINPGESASYVEFISGGQAYRYPKAGGSIIAVPSSSKITLVLGSGQSLSTGDGTDTGDISPAVNPYPHHVMMLDDAGESIGRQYSAIDPNDITGLLPLANPDNKDSYGNGALVQAMRQFEHAGAHQPTFIWASHGRNGSSISELSDTDTYWMYNNGLIQATKAKEIAESYGLTLDTHVYLMWVQGEADSSNANYANELVALYDQYVTDLKTIISPTMQLTMIIDQLGRTYSKVVSEQQRIAARERNIHIAMQKTAVCNRYYPADLYMDNGDHTHLTKAGYWLQGGYFGRALYNLMRTGTHAVPQPSQIRLTGNQIVVDFSGAERLSVDPELASSHLGFSYDDDSSSASIASVQLTGDTQVTITLSTAPTGTNPVLRHGWQDAPNAGVYEGIVAINLYQARAEYLPEVDKYLDLYCLAFEHYL